MLTSGERRRVTLGGFGFLGVGRRRESAPEDGSTRVTPEHLGSGYLLSSPELISFFSEPDQPPSAKRSKITTGA